MSEPTNQPSHRPLREGEIIRLGDECKDSRTGWRKCRGSIGERYDPNSHMPMRRPVKD